MKLDEHGRVLAYLANLASDSKQLKGGKHQFDYDHEPNLVTSRLPLGGHRPVFDLDFACRLLPSSTPGKFHLYMDGIVLDDAELGELLKVMTKVGIVQEGWSRWHEVDGACCLRLPGVTKEGAQKPPPLDEEPF